MGIRLYESVRILVACIVILAYASTATAQVTEPLPTPAPEAEPADPVDSPPVVLPPSAPSEAAETPPEPPVPAVSEDAFELAPDELERLMGDATESSSPVAESTTTTPATSRPRRIDDAGGATARIDEPVQATSSITLDAASLRRRLVLSAGDMLAGAPGFYVVQHGGGGKANQYFLRGFDADHGTDVGLFVDGIPVNLPTHGHGQGYSELQWIIPELVERVEIRKGPFFAELGDNVVAGAVNFRIATDLPHSFALGSLGMFGTRRMVVGAAPRFDRVRPILAVEAFHSDGPFDHPDDYRRFSVFARATHEVSSGELSWTLQSFGSQWNASGQIPLRSVEDGSISRFGSVDPDEGGANQRHSLSVRYSGDIGDDGHFDVTAFATRSRLTLYSNFSLYAGDTVNGDMIRQIDDRVFGGVRAAYTRTASFGRAMLTVRGGPQFRYDAGNPSVYHAPRHVPMEARLSSKVDLLAAGAFVEADLRYSRYLRVVAGMRVDAMSASVRDRLAAPDEPNQGDRLAMIASPKLSVIGHVGHGVHLFGNFGSGFHSNDARGVVRRGDARVDPFARALAYELGARYERDGLFSASASGYVVDLASEVVFVGDDGSSEPRGATRRIGGEVDVRATPVPWLRLDATASYSHAAFVDNAGNGRSVALAPTWLVQSGVEVVHSTGVSGRLSLVYIADRPATEDGSLVAEGFTRLDANVGYTHRRFAVEVAMQNLTNAVYRQAQFASTTRLPGEGDASACTGSSRPAEENGTFVGCEDITFTPGLPFTLMGSASVFF